MCTDNAERFKSVNNVIAELAAEAGKMNGFIEEYHRLHDADTDAETAISRQKFQINMRRQILTAKSGISNHAAAGIRDDPCLSKFGALHGLCPQAGRQF